MGSDNGVRAGSLRTLPISTGHTQACTQARQRSVTLLNLTDKFTPSSVLKFRLNRKTNSCMCLILRSIARVLRQVKANS